MNENQIKRYFRQKMMERRSGSSSPKTELENLQVLFALFLTRDITAEQAAGFLGCQTYDLGELRDKAIEAGKRLVR